MCFARLPMHSRKLLMYLFFLHRCHVLSLPSVYSIELDWTEVSLKWVVAWVILEVYFRTPNKSNTLSKYSASILKGSGIVLLLEILDTVFCRVFRLYKSCCAINSQECFKYDFGIDPDHCKFLAVVVVAEDFSRRFLWALTIFRQFTAPNFHFLRAIISNLDEGLSSLRSDGNWILGHTWPRISIKILLCLTRTLQSVRSPVWHTTFFGGTNST